MAKESVLDIYIVDEDDIYLNFLRKRFQLDLPYNLYTFNSAKKFLRHFIHNDTKIWKNKKIVILDYFLKCEGEADAKTGMELLPIIKHHNQDADVIMMSGRVMMNLKPTAGNYTPTMFIRKDDNAIQHLSSTVKKIGAKYELDTRARRSNFARNIFIAVVLLSILAFLLNIMFL